MTDVGTTSEQIARPAGPAIIIGEGGMIFLEFGQFISIPLGPDEARKIGDGLFRVADAIDPEGADKPIGEDTAE